MKYTILGFQQEKLIQNGLSVEDAFILRTIKDMYSSASMEFKDFDGIKYMWINYSYLLEQIPIIGSKRNLMRKIEFYGKESFLLRILQKERNGVKGNYSYISPTEKLDEMQDFDLMTESHKVMTESHNPYDKNVITLMTESHNKDTSIKDTSIKDTSIKDNNYKEIYDYYLSLKLIKHREYTNDMVKAISSAMKNNKYTIEYCKTLLDRHKKVVELTKSNKEYKVRARSLTEFFGQKVANAKHLICSEYEEGGTKYEKYLRDKEESKKENKPVKVVVRECS